MSCACNACGIGGSDKPPKSELPKNGYDWVYLSTIEDWVPVDRQGRTLKSDGSLISDREGGNMGKGKNKNKDRGSNVNWNDFGEALEGAGETIQEVAAPDKPKSKGKPQQETAASAPTSGMSVPVKVGLGLALAFGVGKVTGVIK